MQKIQFRQSRELPSRKLWVESQVAMRICMRMNVSRFILYKKKFAEKFSAGENFRIHGNSYKHNVIWNFFASDAKLVTMTSEEALDKPEDKASSIDSGNNTNGIASSSQVPKVRHRKC